MSRNSSRMGVEQLENVEDLKSLAKVPQSSRITILKFKVICPEVKIKGLNSTCNMKNLSFK